MRFLEHLHPLVLVVYMAGVLVLSMLSLEPISIALSLCGACSFGVLTRGWRPMLQFVRWQLVCVGVIAVANFLLSSTGSTELFRIGMRAFYLESLLFGLCMGALLMAVMVWFWDFASLLTSEKVETVFGNRAPTLAIMISMIGRLIPQFVRQGHEIDEVHQGCSAASAQRPQPLQAQFRHLSVLAGWTLEDSLETAYAMKARGWGYAPVRTTYKRFVFGRTDALCLGAVVALLGLSGVGALLSVSSFHFYPVMNVSPSMWHVWSAVLFFAPSFVVIKERCACNR